MEDFSVEDRLNEIWRQGRDFGLTDSEIHHVLTTVVQERKQNDDKHQISRKSQIKNDNKNSGSRYIFSRLLGVVKAILKLSLSLLLFLIFGCILISLHNPTRKFVTRNIQDFIYPVMTRLRKTTLPILAKYPELSSWYSEECLLKNPFFDHINVDCNVCAENAEPDIVTSIDNFTDVYYNNGKLVIINNVVKAVPWTELVKKIDIEKEENLGAWKVSVKNNDDYSPFREQLSYGIFASRDLHIEWKINRLETLHILRQLLPRLYFIPQDTEISLHRYVFIDGPGYEGYPLPISEFANVVLVQGEGSSVLKFVPSPHCETDCQSVTLSLTTSQVLFFNWIFWRPTRVGGEGISTVILSSFY